MRIIEHSDGLRDEGERSALRTASELFKMGDTSVAECADVAHEMLASCTAMGKLASYDSRHLKDFVRVCIGVCEDCEKACREHGEEACRM